MQGNTFTSQPVSAADIPLEDVSRVDIEFEQVDHSGASFEGRVFLNNPEADENTDPSPENGYAGSFFIFGHGGASVTKDTARWTPSGRWTRMIREGRTRYYRWRSQWRPRKRCGVRYPKVETLR